MAATVSLTTNDLPSFIANMNAEYKATISNVFLVHGNIYDYTDNCGKDLTIRRTFCSAYDDAFSKNDDETQVGILDEDPPAVTRIVATFNLGQGLEFPHQASAKLIRTRLSDKFTKEKVTDQFMKPMNVPKLIEFMNIWFTISKERSKENKVRRDRKLSPLPEILVTWVIFDADAIFPNGSMAHIGGDRMPIVSLREWSQDDWIGLRNRIVLVTRNASDIHTSIRNEIASVHLVKKPTLQERLSYIQGFDRLIRARAEMSPTKKITVGDNSEVKGITWAPEFNAEQCAIQSAGMNRKQIRDVFYKCWISNTSVDYQAIIKRKQRALQDEYQGMLDFREPTFGFEEIGGNDHFKRYCRERIITPLKEQDIRTCSGGVLMIGPPGTGKSMLAMALAKEAEMNFMIVDIGKVFAGLVGDSEKNMRMTIEAMEAAAPCIVFMDELDTVFASGRSGGGDSGTSSRVMNTFMTFMSDPGRRGRIVVMGATNRPDLIDAALIRDGRLDLKIPILPPTYGDRKGRGGILMALTKKHKVKFDKALEPTTAAPKNGQPERGLGRLLGDMDRIWTGAEIESLMREAMAHASVSGRKDSKGSKDYNITLEDWDYAMDVIIPSTGDVELQTSLALFHTNNMGFCPPEWIERARDKATLKTEIATMLRAA